MRPSIERRAGRWVPLRGERLGRAVDLSHLHWAFEPDSTRHLTGMVTTRHIGPLRVSWVKAELGLGRWRGWRNEDEIRANPEPYVTVVMPIERSIVLSSGETKIEVGTNDLAIWDSTLPFAFDIEAERYEQVSVLVPRRVLRAGTDACRALHCTRVDDTNILSELCVQHMATLAEFLDSPLRPYEMSLTHVTTSLVDAVIASLYQAPRDRDLLLQDIKTHIECYIDDESLSPQHIAEAFEISTRYLHKLFRTESATVTEWIINRRLERSAEDLLTSDVPITEIAFKWGFKALGHYSRTFKTRFGETPTAYRRAASGPVG